ncbi:transposase-like protein [Beauveria bassiana ARSEF 2860]|uniref:Transposase-like protein n=1 Tax=Beauveria bassiana (strain ARSEF 2860) TaxID=655819 RepID=J5J623_BEAB2|nr:transposase-like protein [Beauveria bassiana ARSEF 2860]EJP61993.1 transposase-like protein [Beauveria bassiana ARSEF 2860]
MDFVNGRAGDAADHGIHSSHGQPTACGTRQNPVGENWMIKQKWGVLDEDIYNFDETGFQMEVIAGERPYEASYTRQAGTNPACQMTGILASVRKAGLPDDLGLQWLKEVFDPSTRRRTVGTHRLLILDGHGSHVAPEFDQYCTANSIVVVQMPTHSSHLLQPFDVGCFSPLKTIYGRKVQEKMLAGINHIDKHEFLPLYLEARRQALSSSNIRSGCMATGLRPFNPSQVLTKLQVQVGKRNDSNGWQGDEHTPSPQKGQSVCKTPYNINQLATHTDALLQRWPQIQDSPVSQAIYQLIKGCQMAMHSAILLADENCQLRSENQRQNGKRKSGENI